MWKQIIIDCNNTNYEVSTNGEIKNSKTGKLLKQSIQQGYKHVGLTINGKVKRCRVHRLVAIAFILNPENKPYVNHKDGCRSNNLVDNLEWCTPQENTQHAVAIGLMQPTREHRVCCYHLDGTFIEEFVSLSEAARVTNSNVSKIVLCCQLQRNTHNNCQWRYIEDKVDRLSPAQENCRIRKQVAQLDQNGIILNTYSSINEAAKAVNGTQSAITRVLNGTRQTKTHKGFGWKLVDEIVQ